MTKLDTTTLTSIALSVLAANVFRADMGSFFILYLVDSPEDYGKTYMIEFEDAA